LARTGEACRNPGAVPRQCADKRAAIMDALAHTRLFLSGRDGIVAQVARESAVCIYFIASRKEIDSARADLLNSNALYSVSSCWQRKVS